MPGLNGTGPMGEGPATGGGFGTCARATAAADLDRRGRGRGAGRRAGGRGMQLGFRGGAHLGGPGRGRGLWGRGRFSAPPDPSADRPSLESEAADLNARLEKLERRLANLETPGSGPLDG